MKNEMREPLEDDLEVGRCTIIVRRFQRVEGNCTISSEMQKGHGLVVLVLGVVHGDQTVDASEVLRSLGWEFRGHQVMEEEERLG